MLILVVFMQRVHTHNLQSKPMVQPSLHHGFVLLCVLWVLVIAPWCCIIHCAIIGQPLMASHHFVCDEFTSAPPASVQAIHTLPLPVILSTGVFLLVIKNYLVKKDRVALRSPNLIGIVALPHTPPPRGVH